MRYNDYGVISELGSLPGNSQVAVSHTVFLPTKFHKDKGVGQNAMRAREVRINSLGYDVCLCTVIKTNEREIHILEKNGWRFLASWKSTRTDNVVCLYGRSVNAPLNTIAPPKRDIGVDLPQYYEDYKTR